MVASSRLQSFVLQLNFRRVFPPVCLATAVIVQPRGENMPFAHSASSSFSAVMPVRICKQVPPPPPTQLICTTRHAADMRHDYSSCRFKRGVRSTQSELEHDTVNGQCPLLHSLLHAQRPHTHNVSLDTIAPQSTCDLIHGNFTSLLSSTHPPQAVSSSRTRSRPEGATGSSDWQQTPEEWAQMQLRALASDIDAVVARTLRSE